MKGREVIEQCENLSNRKLDYWCQQGVFGDRHINDRLHRRRVFDEDDLRVAQVISRVSNAFGAWSGGRGGFVGLYREIAHQVRAGTTPTRVVLAQGVDIVIDVDRPSATENTCTLCGRAPTDCEDIPACEACRQAWTSARDVQQDQPPEPPVEPELAVTDEPAESGFIPGISIDNA